MYSVKHKSRKKNSSRRAKLWRGLYANYNIDCSQSPIFSCDRIDIPRLTVTAILIFKCTEGAGVVDYSSGAGGTARKIEGL